MKEIATMLKSMWIKCGLYAGVIDYQCVVGLQKSRGRMRLSTRIYNEIK